MEIKELKFVEELPEKTKPSEILKALIDITTETHKIQENMENPQEVLWGIYRIQRLLGEIVYSGLDIVEEEHALWAITNCLFAHFDHPEEPDTPHGERDDNEEHLKRELLILKEKVDKAIKVHTDPKKLHYAIYECSYWLGCSIVSLPTVNSWRTYLRELRHYIISFFGD